MWVARLQSSDATDRDRRDFSEWLARDPSRGPAYEELRNLWVDLKDVPIPANRLKTLQRVRRTRLASVAVLLVAAVMSASVYRMGVVDRWQSDYYTVIGEVRTIRLEDGTYVDLNTDSAIAVRYSRQERRVELLRGEAFFNVAKNPARPFVVEDGSLAAKAVGTRYAVRSGYAGILSDVQVEEGRVEVTAPRDHVFLDPGDAATLTDQGDLEISRRDVPNQTAWRDGKLAFSERPLGEVLATLERYRSGRILVLDNAAAQRKVSGIFDLKDTDKALQALADSLPISVTRLSDMMVIVRSR